MLIHGREVGLRLTMRATLDIAKLTPHESIDEIGDVLGTATFAGQLELIVKFIAALSRGYEEAKRYEEPGYVPNPVTEEELLSLDMADLNRRSTATRKRKSRSRNQKKRTLPPHPHEPVVVAILRSAVRNVKAGDHEHHLWRDGRHDLLPFDL